VTFLAALVSIETRWLKKNTNEWSRRGEINGDERPDGHKDTDVTKKKKQPAQEKASYFS
jgi:hypothetical protein